MRHGSTSAYMGSPAGPGLIILVVLRLEVDTLDFVVRPECQNTQELPIGSIPPN